MEGSDTRVTMLGGDGEDELLLFESDSTTAIISGGAEDDIIINLGTGTAVLTAFGEDGDDVVIGGAGADWLDGGAGEDVLIGGVLANDGDDTLMGGGDDDVLVGSDGADSLDAGAGEDLIISGWLDDVMYGEEEPPGFYLAYSEWLQSGSVQDRMNRLQGLQAPITVEFHSAYYLLPGVTVINDTYVDLIMAGSGEADGVFYDFEYDRFQDEEVEDVKVDISLP